MPDARIKRGTLIVIKQLHDEVKMRVSDPAFINQLQRQISRTYSWFLNRAVDITLNGVPIEGFQIPIAQSDIVQMGHESFQYGGVDVNLFSSLADQSGTRGWRDDTSGWYVFCNGRAVVVADKTELTGWGAGAFPRYQPKFRGFVGLAFFFSDDPLTLPWTTTKRGLNHEAAVYQFTKAKMQGVGRPVITFLGGRYRADVEELEKESSREVSKGLTSVDIGGETGKAPKPFKVQAPPSRKTKTIRIQYDAPVDWINAIREHLRKKKMAASSIGKRALEYYMNAEGIK